MDLFDQTAPKTLKPLAELLRPATLEEFIGQKHLLEPGKVLHDLIVSENIPSMILWGPPGVGKTTLAKIIANCTKHHFVTLSAVNSGIKDVKDVMDKARVDLSHFGKKTILFIDEIHRFNKSQQDAFLPHVEDGTIILIGATTENPSFELNAALLSRCQVFILNSLSEDELKEIIQRALTHRHKTNWMTDDALNYLVSLSYGDARYLLNVVEDVLNLFANETSITLELIQDRLAQRAHLYDKKSEHHYNVISAFIKSMRGSDPDAALYYLARMLESGEDPLFIARRMVIFASEDIGLANPQAVQVAVACMQSYDFIGKGEGWIPLAHCAVFLAGSPKSNASYAGYKLALEDVKKFGALEVPLHLRNAPTKLMKSLDYGKDYKYAHSHSGNKVEQQHLPDQIKSHRYYHPTENGHEKKIKEWLDQKPT